MKPLLRSLGVNHVYWALRRAREVGPTYFTNWLFQRLIGINRDCPWSVHFTSRVMHPKNLKVHPTARVSFAVNGGCYIQATNGIQIGERTIFAAGVKIVSANHHLETLADAAPAPPVEIGAYCWLGANAVILPGVTLGDHVIVGAGSVVTRSFPAGSVIGGVPAKLIRMRTIETEMPKPGSGGSDITGSQLTPA